MLQYLLQQKLSLSDAYVVSCPAGSQDGGDVGLSLHCRKLCPLWETKFTVRRDKVAEVASVGTQFVPSYDRNISRKFQPLPVL
jgi:hypothetical protein